MLFKKKNPKVIERWLANFEHPCLPEDWQSAGVSINITAENIVIHFPFASTGLERALTEWIAINPCPWPVTCEFEDQIQAMKNAQNKAFSGIKNCLLVSSAKGGVGKSTTAVNLALAIAQQGGKVGILDADIYGPSIPHLLGTQGQFPESPDDRVMHPIEKFGIFSHSIGYLVPEEDAAVWRGPMAAKAIQQIMNETRWPDLDYLIIDMPPGTGDIQLTIAQQFPVTSALIVTTPQDLALIDAIKGIAMFEKVNIPVLGVIENMSTHTCSKCGHSEAIFGESGAQRLVDEFNLPLLAQLPLHIAIRQDCDQGKPTVVQSPEHILAKQYNEMALAVCARLFFSGEKAAEQINIKQL